MKTTLSPLFFAVFGLAVLAFGILTLVETSQPADASGGVVVGPYTVQSAGSSVSEYPKRWNFEGGFVWDRTGARANIGYQLPSREQATCNAAHRHWVYSSTGADGGADLSYVCARDVDGSYGWSPLERVVTSGPKPTCDASHRHWLYSSVGSDAGPDSLELCARAVNGTYSWVTH